MIFILLIITYGTSMEKNGLVYNDLSKIMFVSVWQQGSRKRKAFEANGRNLEANNHLCLSAKAGSGFT